jgi:hypothetical protein
MAFVAKRKTIHWLRLGLASVGLVLAGLFAVAGVQAADLDHPYYRYHHRRLPPPPVVFLPTPPSCKVVPLPEMNLFNEVTRAGIQNVCVSRGVYADSFWPYASSYWRPNHRQGYGPESGLPW